MTIRKQLLFWPLLLSASFAKAQPAPMQPKVPSTPIPAVASKPSPPTPLTDKSISELTKLFAANDIDGSAFFESQYLDLSKILSRPKFEKLKGRYLNAAYKIKLKQYYTAKINSELKMQFSEEEAQAIISWMNDESKRSLVLKLSALSLRSKNTSHAFFNAIHRSIQKELTEK